MGDVALVAAALKKVISENPNVTIIMVSRIKFKVFFEGIPQITFYEADFKVKHKGFLGLLKLFLALKKQKPALLIDLHQNLRTFLLKGLFKMVFLPVFTINKGRKEKQNLIKNNFFFPLKNTTTRYLEVFQEAKLIDNTNLGQSLLPIFIPKPEIASKTKEFLKTNLYPNKTLIGIAPFTQHKGKTWPIQNYKEVIIKLLKESNETLIFIFGGGESEKNLINQYLVLSDRTINMVGKMNLEEELSLIANLKLMLTGDTSNMHLAALSSIPTLSIWGATHTHSGFAPLHQPPENILEIPKEELTCRPCSVYGNKPCARKDYACLNFINSDTVVNKILEILHPIDGSL
jgi:ADP-heptose:LPS heptosyltransferase